MPASGLKSTSGSAFSCSPDPDPRVVKLTTVGFGVVEVVVGSTSMAEESAPALGCAETVPESAARRSSADSDPRMARTSGASTTRVLKSFRGRETEPARTA